MGGPPKINLIFFHVELLGFSRRVSGVGLNSGPVARASIGLSYGKARRLVYKVHDMKSNP